MNKYLILTYEFPPLIGGAGTYARELAIGLSMNGHSSSIITCHHKGKNQNDQDDKKLIKNNIFISRFKSFGKLFYIQMYIKLRKTYGNKFHKHFDGIFLADIRAIKFAMVFFSDSQLSKSINIFHGGQVESLILNPNLLIRLLGMQKQFLKILKKVMVNLTVSQNLRNSFIRELPGYEKYFYVTLHGIDPAIFHPISLAERSEIRKKYGISQKDLILISLSRIVPGKGQDYLIIVFKKLVEKNIGITLLIAGDGSERIKLERLVKKLNLTTRVLFLGALSRQEAALIIAACDLSIMLSRIPYEAFGLVNIEANACGIPVLASKIAGVQESVENGISGILVDPFDINEIEKKLESMLNYSFLKQLGSSAYKRTIDYFTCEKMAARTIEIINNLNSSK